MKGKWYIAPPVRGKCLAHLPGDQGRLSIDEQQVGHASLQLLEGRSERLWSFLLPSWRRIGHWPAALLTALDDERNGSCPT
jgi:hypothetical protein